MYISGLNNKEEIEDVEQKLNQALKMKKVEIMKPLFQRTKIGLKRKIKMKWKDGYAIE